MEPKLAVKFWGTRGLISTPGSENSIFGGNTTCIQIIWKDQLILVDTGFGASVLGETLMPLMLKEKQKFNAHIFYTHFHWDHVQGLPFFHPIYFKSQSLNIYSPAPVEFTKSSLDVLFDGTYSPFSGIDSMAANINIRQLSGSMDISGLEVEHIEINHISMEDQSNISKVYGYKFTSPEGESICIITDHEATEGKANESVVNFCKNTNILIHDGQFTEEEYKNHIGWGHSSIEAALKNQSLSNAKKCILTHHAPSHDDKFIQEYQRKLVGSPEFVDLNYDFARERVLYSVDENILPVEDET